MAIKDRLPFNNDLEHKNTRCNIDIRAAQRPIRIVKKKGKKKLK